MTEVLICPNPDDGTEVSVVPNVDSQRFTDGYEQSMGRGIFNSPREVPIRWSNLRYSEATALIDFLDSTHGYEKFLYTLPEEPQRLYKCKKFSYKWKKGRRCDVSATFEEQAG